MRSTARRYDKLSKMRGAEFDRAYMRDMVQDHEKDVKKFRQEAQHGGDPDLKGFAQKTLPVLEQHLKMAHDTNKSLTAVGSSGQHEPQSGPQDTPDRHCPDRRSPVFASGLSSIRQTPRKRGSGAQPHRRDRRAGSAGCSRSPP